VQGVGFRPFVRNLAVARGLTGEVANTEFGVRIRVFGELESVEAFERDLLADPPRLARIHRVESAPLRDAAPGDFLIVPSEGGEGRSVGIPPDAAVCADCVRELFDPANRRYRYPFINCTHCGPRYTIIEDIPYDRPNTTMSVFDMCEACAAEYEDPADRRYHAQPNACPACGPHLSLVEGRGRLIEGDPLGAAARLLREGAIVAVKGLGGFHLAVDAGNDEAVRRLRRRKHREDKPFAVMVRDMDAARRLVVLSRDGEAVLEGSAAPIVLASKRSGAPVAEAVSPRVDRHGVMLAYTPLHLLLLDEGPGVLVMTSANRTDEPIVIDNEEAFERLEGVADALLLHNRAIAQRMDDSVLADNPTGRTMVRRSRGYAPAGLEVGLDVDGVLAFGPHLKNAPCLGRGSQLYVGQHVGDLDHRLSLEMFAEVRGHLQSVLGLTPLLAACDLHPDYATTRLAEASGLPLERVQHHHAHLVSVMAEHGCYGRAMGVALDGAGYGGDGTIWGGEILIFDPVGYQRVAHLQTVPQPGGDVAAREPWRMAAAQLWRHGLTPPQGWAPDGIDEVRSLLESGLPVPSTSSAGRLFDAVASLLGIRDVNRFEAQAAMELEAAADDDAGSYPFPTDAQMGVLQTGPLLAAILADLEAGVEVGRIAARFHNGFADGIARCVRSIALAEGLEDVYLSGGVSLNRRVTARLVKQFSECELTLRMHRLLSPGDGCVSAGQAVVAAARRAMRSGEGDMP
jgi:hydrogenase maturation protein HypF